MSNHTRILMIAVTLAAMNLAGLTALAYAQATHQPASNHDAQRPPTEGEVRKPYRYYHDALAAQAQRAEDDAVERFWQSERASQEQPITDNPTQVTAPRQPAEPNGQPGWLVVSVVMLVALVAGVGVVAARRSNRRTRVGVGQAT